MKAKDDSGKDKRGAVLPPAGKKSELPLDLIAIS